jgi:hypothetical protein
MRRLATILCILSVAAISVAASPPASAPSRVPTQVDPARLTAPVTGVPAAAGRLLDARGHAVRGTVAAVVWPSEAMNRDIRVGDSFVTPTVGWTRTGTDGTYTIEVDPSLIPEPYLEPDGRVNLEFVGWTDEWTGSWGAPATPSSGLLMATASGADLLVGDIVADQPMTSYRAVSDDAVAPAAGDVASSPTPCTWNLRSEFDVNTSIGRTWTSSTDRGWMYSGSSQGMTVGYGFSLTGAYGTWTQKGTTSATSGVTFEWNESTTDLQYFVAQRYGRYQLMSCAGQWQNNWQAKYRFNIGTHTTGSPGTKPGFPSCYPNDAGLWTRNRTDGHSLYLSGGVKSQPGLGVDLSAESNWSQTHILKYRLMAYGKLCGTNDVPALASEVQTWR